MPKKQPTNENPDEDNIINQAEDIKESAGETSDDQNEPAVSQTDPEMDEYLADEETIENTATPVSSETNVFEPPGDSGEQIEEPPKEAPPPDTPNESQFDNTPIRRPRRTKKAAGNLESAAKADDLTALAAHFEATEEALQHYVSVVGMLEDL